jgi:hypothetical protein
LDGAVVSSHRALFGPAADIGMTALRSKRPLPLVDWAAPGMGLQAADRFAALLDG